MFPIFLPFFVIQASLCTYAQLFRRLKRKVASLLDDPAVNRREFLSTVWRAREGRDARARRKDVSTAIYGGIINSTVRSDARSGFSNCERRVIGCTRKSLSASIDIYALFWMWLRGKKKVLEIVWETFRRKIMSAVTLAFSWSKKSCEKNAQVSRCVMQESR